ncbi:MAG TPA: nitroreductase [Candidatus Anoxymicrobiaceae bacterium]|jgi:nitroreductase
MDETAVVAGETENAAGADWNPVERVILERRSVRKYKDRQVPENVVRRILEAGRFAPSAGNAQPWKFIVIRDRAMLDEMERDVVRLCKVFKFFLDWRTSPLGRSVTWLMAQVFIRIKRNQLHPIPFGAITLIAEGKLRAFHGAPTLILLLEDRRGVSRPQVDVGCCGENIVLAAQSMGLGTCWVGFVELLKYGLKWRKRLGIEFPYRICEGICLGYPVGNPQGMIEREVMDVDWYEDGAMRKVRQGEDDVTV